MYLVLVCFHASGGVLKPRYLHRRALLGCNGASAIQDPALYQDLCSRQKCRLAQGQNLHGKLAQLLGVHRWQVPHWFDQT